MSEPLCPPWLSFTLTNVFRRMAHDPVRILSPFIKPGDVALDIGCGPGFFTVPMARMVGERGQVIAVDIQPKMLERAKQRAARAGFADRVRTHLATSAGWGSLATADFALAFWMAHEVEGLAPFFAETLACLRPGGALLLVEPKVHVSERRFEEILSAAEGAGFRRQPAGSIRLSRAVILRPGRPSAPSEPRLAR